MSTEVQPQDLPAVTNVERPMSVNELLKQSLSIHEVLTRVMVKDVHYGVIPGTPKPTLYQAGAEKICSTFRLAPRYEVEDLCEPHNNFYRYRVKCSLVTIRDGLFVGSAMGEASSAEEKYQWEKAVCQKQWDMADPDKRRVKFQRTKDSDDGFIEILQVQRNCADLANTVLKIGCKRAYISAVKSATAASDIMDVDMDEEAVADLHRTEQKEQAKPKAKSSPAPKLPFGHSKGKAIDDPEVPLGDLTYMLEYVEKNIGSEKRKRYEEQDRKFMAALQTEIAKRQAAPKQAAGQPDQAPGAMDMEAWTDYCAKQLSAYEAEYTQACMDFKVQDPTTLPVEAWKRFQDHMKALTFKK